MAIQQLSDIDPRMHLSDTLVQILSDLQMSLRALPKGFYAVCDSSLRHAFISGCNALRFKSLSDDPVVVAQMNHVNAKLQHAVDAINIRETISPRVLEAAVAIFDAQSVIFGAPLREEFSTLLDDISRMFQTGELSG